jgi:nucleotide-binding universal stress UspA family protein
MKQGVALVKEFASRLREAKVSNSLKETIVEGDAKAEVLSQVDEYKPDLVIVGSHGKKGLRLLGSVSRAVVAECKCSVMVVPLVHDEDKHKMHIIV